MCPTADGNVRCEWDSTSPGMTVAPVQSTTWSPGSDLGAAAGPHALDAVAPDHHVGGHRRSTGPVEDLPVDEQNAIHIQK